MVTWWGDYALFDTRPLETWKHCGELRPGCPSPVRMLVEPEIHGDYGSRRRPQKVMRQHFHINRDCCGGMQRAHVKIGEGRNALEEHPAADGLRLGLNGPSRWADVPCDPLMHDSRSAKS